MRLYITGGTGLVGSNLIKLAQERYNAEVIASLYGPPPEGAVSYTLDPLDLRDHDAIRIDRAAVGFAVMPGNALAQRGDAER